MKKYKLAVLETHPVQYRLPIYKKLNDNSRIDLTVYFCSKLGIGPSIYPDFGRKVSFPMSLDGFSFKFLKNFYRKNEIVGTAGLWNFGIIKELYFGKYDAIIIYGYGSFTSKVALVASKIFGIPTIFREEIDLVHYGKGVKKWLKDLLFPILFRQYDAFLCSYSKNMDFYLYHGVPKEKLFLHPCSVDNEFFQREAKKYYNKKLALKRKLGIDKKNKIILSVGKLMERKRPMDLIKAYERMSSNKNVSLVFLGDGLEKEKLIEYCNKHNLKNVHFEGFRDSYEVAKYYSIADVFVIPSRHDPSPKAMNEAMNFKLPIIASENTGTAHDMIKGNGFICPVGDISCLSDSIDKILGDSKLAKKMGDISLKIVNKWSPEADVKAIVKVLNYLHKKNDKK